MKHESRKKTDQQPITEEIENDVIGDLPIKTTRQEFTGSKVQTIHDTFEQLYDLEKEDLRKYFNIQPDAKEGCDGAKVVQSVTDFCTLHLTKQSEDDQQNRLKQEWRAVADVTDRLLLIVFTVVVISACIGIFMQVMDDPPNNDI